MTTTPPPSIFTKIINREIPATIIYEDEAVIAFFTIKPLALGHTIVVPKVPFLNIFDGNEKQFGELLSIAQKIAVGLVAAGLADGVNIAMNNGESAGQEVFHAHLHVIPRFEGDGVFAPAIHLTPDSATVAMTAKKLKECLAL